MCIRHKIGYRKFKSLPYQRQDYILQYILYQTFAITVKKGCQW